MTATVEERFAPAIDDLKAMLSEIEEKVNSYSLADAIREGSKTSKQAYNWGSGHEACALSAAVISIKARGLC